MSTLDLGGFDVIVHLAESSINKGLELIPSGSTFPIDLRQNVTLTPTVGAANVPLVYDALVELERPQITIDQQNNSITVRCELSPASELTFIRFQNASQASLLTNVVQQIPLAGTLELSCPFGVANVTTVLGDHVLAGAAAVANAAGVTPTLTLTIPSANGANVPLATAVAGGSLVQLTVATIADDLEAAIGTHAGDAIGTLPLTSPVRLNAGATAPQRVKSILARISAVGQPPAISLGVLTDLTPSRPGSPSAATIPAPPGDLVDGALGVANYWIVQLVCSAMQQTNPGLHFSFAPDVPSATFAGSVALPGGSQPVALKNLTLTASPGKIAVVGDAAASGSCWDATFHFTFDFGFSCNPETGAVTAQASIPDVTPHVHKDLLCEIIGAIIGTLLGLVSGAIIGGLIGGSLLNIPGAVVGAIIGGVAGAIGGFLAADALIDPLDVDGVSLDSLSVLGGLTVPLPLGAAGFLVDVCDFDDLSVKGGFPFVDFAERHRSGSVTLAVGQAFDLDSGVIRNGVAPSGDDPSDLFLGAGGLATIQGAVLGPIFATSKAFDTTSLTALQRLAYAAGTIPSSQLGPRRSVAFAVRTDEGRYAKCRAHRNLLAGVTIEYVVYEQPRPCLGTSLTIDTIAKTVVDSGTVTCTVHRTRPPTTTLPPFPAPHPMNVLARPVQLEDLGPVRRPPVLPLPPRPDACGGSSTVETEEVDWQIVDRRRQLVLRALPRGATAPLVYRWNVFGTELTGSGTASIAGVGVTYDENSPILTMIAPEGVDVAGSIVVNATDADGRSLQAIRDINSTSRKRLGGCCDPTHPKLTLHDAAVLIEQAKIAERVFDAGMRRLSNIAAVGAGKELAPITVADAVKRLQ